MPKSGSPLTVVVNSRGQITLPVSLCRKFSIKDGTRIMLLEEGGRIVLQPITREYIARLRGSLKGGNALSVLIDERKSDRQREDKSVSAHKRALASISRRRFRPAKDAPNTLDLLKDDRQR